MRMHRFTLKLPVIPEPENGTRSVLVRPPGGELTPFIRSDGPANLLCGNCSLTLVKGVDAGQITNLVLKCPQCGSFNDIPFVPALEDLVAELLALPNPKAAAEKLKKAVEEARDAGVPQDRLIESVQADSEALASLISLLVPKSAGDFYSMLGCIVAFLAFMVTLRQNGAPSVVVNQYFQTQAAPAGVSRKSPCPCGSRRKFKHCHGRKP